MPPGRDRPGVAPGPHADATLHEVDHLLIGGGMAASAAAATLADLAPDRTVAIVGEEADGPYERPALSKDAWDPEATEAELLHDGELWPTATVRTGVRIQRLDPDARTATDDRGRRWRWRRSALLATGATPRRPPFADAPHPRIRTFRTLADLRRLRADFTRPARVTVVGAGLLGCELAWTLRHAAPGHAVTLAHPDRRPLASLLPPAFGRRLALQFRRAGIEVRPHVLIRDATAASADPDGPIALHGDDGTSWTADLALACVGVRPNDALARDAGVACDPHGGVLVDDRLRTSVPHLFAVGDAAVPDLPVVGRLRVEHEDFAKSGGVHAGHVMAGTDAPYDRIPSFWCDLAGVGFEGAGRCDASLPHRLYGPAAGEDADLEAPGLVTYHRPAAGGAEADAVGDVVGVLAWNLLGAIEEATDLIRAGAPGDPDAIARILQRRA